ncbi:3-phosphoshikimate 1-carboxyvinyltransferase [Marivirga arenosa]|uniref:3-phosphoshikimate 1-carboxyvinyltransferase n=1 Tax=Marivirga arenosa TaxID=3059076 RepID=A0AA51ZXM4_9BACT|nr:3-phosphoshikimate 1-carboxyvinyltransferase [Marivirga sp. BKB1-2]WNB18613.1 3-phosphoshikimate 1-carboxyvinyltransferase [Marivirga sp. BKB1-2]
MKALSNDKINISNLSKARDTQTLIKLLKEKNNLKEFDVLDAGTAMRFLTAYLAISTTQEVCITGTERMQKRPIKILVEALQKSGASIEYIKEEGFPPLKIESFKEQKTNQISIPGNISSQYISALLMIAPKLKNGLEISIKTPIFSKPYIDMTLGLMKLAGIEHTFNENKISIQAQEYQNSNISVETDWSAASYWFSIIALSDIGKKVILTGLKEKSFQGDSIIKEITKDFGVKYSFDDTQLILEKVSTNIKANLTIDFKKFPDLAQTILPCAAALGINMKMTGLESLKIKETDRVVALTQELAKFSVELKELNDSHWMMDSNNFKFRQGLEIATYEDHRMAMGFAPLAMLHDISILDVEVVNKSYPSFWEDLNRFGFNLTEQ